MSVLSRYWASLTSTSGALPWGDGLVDLSLSTLWYRCSWETVTDDELVFFYPPLSPQIKTADPIVSPAARIRERMLPVASSILRHFEVGRWNEQSSQCSLEQLRRSGAANVLLRSAEADDFSPFQERRFDDFCAIDALCRLATMDRMLHDAQFAVRESDELLLKCITLPDILVGTIHTQINGAYIYPSASYAHELLMAGAWLGTVLTGRAALMPTAVAEVLIDYVTAASPETDESARRIRRILDVYARQAGGRDRLLRTARTTLVKGPQEFKLPRNVGTASSRESEVWHPDLVHNIGRFLSSTEYGGNIGPGKAS